MWANNYASSIPDSKGISWSLMINLSREILSNASLNGVSDHDVMAEQAGIFASETK